jgi:Na+-transporting NADH:ubiquinone oxidoreductase subunit A
MSKTIKLKRGFDINIVGKPDKTIKSVSQPETFALKPTDFHHIIRPKLLVAEGDSVKVGTPIFFEKTMESVMFCSPVSGEVVEIKRGAKRKLLEIKILADKVMEYESFKSYSASDLQSLSRDAAVAHMCAHGVWPQLVQRPFGITASPEDSPKSIFISGFDSHPNAPDTAFILEGKDDNFKVGLEVLKKLTEGKVYLGVNASAEVPTLFSSLEGVQVNKFSGPHPAGNVGTQIHHIDPVNKGEIVWTVSPVGVAKIGAAFAEGKYDSSKVVAVTGSEIETPAYVRLMKVLA